MSEVKDIGWLAKQEYLGRGILIGRCDGGEFAAYFVTGRSPSSRARRFEVVSDGIRGMAIKTAPTDPETLRKGNPALLIYSAVLGVRDGLVVSNGLQTELLWGEAANALSHVFSPVRNLMGALGGSYEVSGVDIASFEPDAPNFTPRISGIVNKGAGALAISKKLPGGFDNPCQKQFFGFPLEDGIGKFISTYTGRNVGKGEVLPSFEGEPLDFVVPGRSLRETAEFIYEALGPKQGGQYVSPGDDFRVGVVVASRLDRGNIPYFMINRCDLDKKNGN
ncbi:MAG: IMP cyclohydrolase [Nanoarchaeota archaeon]|nr:IMP cyclohydrolase [Nanoarchaeota archaeon]